MCCVDPEAELVNRAGRIKKKMEGVSPGWKQWRQTNPKRRQAGKNQESWAGRTTSWNAYSYSRRDDLAKDERSLWVYIYIYIHWVGLMRDRWGWRREWIAGVQLGVKIRWSEKAGKSEDIRSTGGETVWSEWADRFTSFIKYPTQCAML